MDARGNDMAGRAWLRAALLAPATLLTIGAANPNLSPGLWQVRNTPGVATLDGKELDDLPLGPPKVQEICVAPAEAADPVAFFARDTREDCRITSGNLAGGKVEISGRCPNPEEQTEGTMKLSGRYDSESYELDFATTAEDFQGVMTFSGKLTGKRIGACKPPAA